MITFPETASQPQHVPMPKSIRSALLKALAASGEVTPDAHNTHGSYDYASVDAVYDTARGILASVGLGIYFTELSCSYDSEGKRVRFVFQWFLFTEEDEWTDPNAVRTIILPYTGPQTCQAAQSYVDKALLKHLLKLKTGDKEPEDAGMPGVDLKAAKAALDKKTPKLDAMATSALLAKIEADLNKSYGTAKLLPEQMEAFAEKWGAEIAKLDEKSKATVRSWMKERKS